MFSRLRPLSSPLSSFSFYGGFSHQLANVKTGHLMARAISVIPDNRLLNQKLIKHFPHINSQRGRVKIDRSSLWKGRPVMELTEALRSKAGRGNRGQISHRHRGGGHKKRYRIIDFKRSQKYDIPATVVRLEYDPNRNAHIALIQYKDDKSVSYIIAADGLTPGMEIISTKRKEVPIKIGNCMPMGLIPVGTVIHNIELQPGHGAQVARSAGTYAELMDKRGRPGHALLRLRSLEQRYFPLACAATIGMVSNPLANREKIGKAGRNRWKGWRPYVRGVAMNPVDHPMGGGEGKSSGGRPSCSPTGVLSKGYKTRMSAPHPNVLVTRFKAKMMKKRG
eukprot:gb/GEZN01009231.1/.p1 GENE.gb/GEZN01009231.1/~~gb/GEZN01009231.1/.p1  ORF type:complete len:336 (-),score=20.46 gb/GEZN01009231.1/:295-1302(-)